MVIDGPRSKVGDSDTVSLVPFFDWMPDTNHVINLIAPWNFLIVTTNAHWKSRSDNYSLSSCGEFCAIGVPFETM
jgi:hypothetical protein